MKLSSVSTLIVAAIVLGAGCQTRTPHENAGPYAPVTYEGALEKTETIVLLDEGLRHSISVDAELGKLDENQRLAVQANFRNLLARNAMIQVQTVFRDEHGMSTSDETAWQTITLNPNATETYSATALNSKSNHYTVRVRLAR